MDSDSNLIILTAGILTGIIIASILTCILFTENHKVESGKQFIHKNATYKCIKTNELKEGK